MLIKFTSGGRGGGGAVCSYLVDAERMGREHCPPEVVRGDLARTQELIDSIGRQWTYTHGVLSFAPEDAPSVAEQEAAMDAPLVDDAVVDYRAACDEVFRGRAGQ